MSFFSGIYNWFADTLRWLGLINFEANILLLGLDNAGKTSLLHMLKYGRLRESAPTRKPTMQELTLGSIDFKAYDMGGNIRERPLWEDYFPLVDAVVFIVDAADVERLGEAREVLTSLLMTDSLRNVPFLILGNKIDKPEALSEPMLRQQLGLTQFSNNIEVQMCSIVNRMGYDLGFQWVGTQLR
eukprot:TRINITY_DN11182_c0_g1_i1.p1 TRINITY_DN11182_c0_g1~~TRINITY_DN11182_c0_g1_i1.p1  ORF type:complete len:185 (-),score=42.06 TRINITY_DN11182_c0_g1_i1:47-601(-)